MKPDSPTVENVNEDELSLRVMSSLAPAVSVIVNSEDGSVEPDYDMDDEVMNFMHSHIHKQLLKFSGKGAWGAKQKPQQQGLMDQDTKAYFEEVIRGSALFGLMPSREDNDGFDDEEETFDYSSAMDNSPDYHSEPTHEETARTQLSRILLAKKVAEAFMSHKSDRSGADDDDDSYVNPTKPGPLTDSMASLTWDAPLRSAKENALAPDDYNENLSGRISRSSEFTIEADLQTERGDLLGHTPTE